MVQKLTDRASVARAFDQLFSKDNSSAYKALQELQGISENTNLVYPYMDKLKDMLGSDNSYIRTRALTLIAHNARWDEGGKINGMIDAYLKHITDDKPITARQCIRLLPIIAEHKPELRVKIVEALRNANIGFFSESMRPLVRKDITEALLKIESMQ